MSLEWYVYMHDFNRDKVEKFNVFNHWGFREDVQNALKVIKTKEEFSSIIKTSAMYYFWSKAEYELIVTLTKDDHVLLRPWCGSRKPENATIDVTGESYDWVGFAKENIDKQIFGYEAKVDIYNQLEYVWNDFIDYAWESKQL